jgi:predicted amidophosphoribosyltransferase
VRFFRGGVCDDCWSAVPLPDAGCPICADPLPGAEPSGCGRCLLSPPAFSRLSAAAAYRGSARDILIAFKFGGADFLAPRLAEFMAERIARDSLFDEVVAVPGTARARLSADHAAERLGRAVAERLKIRFAGSRLEKIRGTQRQSALPASRRAANVRGAFSARPGAPRRVLLVDDVATSGATARECALALVRSGAEEVEVWCFARASRDDGVLASRDRPERH